MKPGQGALWRAGVGRVRRMQFQPPLEEAFGDFCRKRTFIAGSVIGGYGKEISLAIWKIGDGVART